MKSFIFLPLLVFAVTMSGCTHYFTKVPFKYSSNTYVPPEESFTTSMLRPEDLIYLMSENLRAVNAEIVYRGRSDSLPTQTPESHSCWAAVNEIAQAEFATYRANDPETFFKMDRPAIFTKHAASQNCVFVAMTPTNDPRVLLIGARMRTRSATASVPVETIVQSFQTSQGTGTVGNFGAIPFNYSTQTTGIQVGTREKTVENTVNTVYYMWMWPSQTGGSNLYAVALPESGGVMAQPGNSIGYLWWQQVDGRPEATIVRDLYYRLDEEEHALRSTQGH